jgi:T4 bacteriophage base plate protein
MNSAVRNPLTGHFRQPSIYIKLPSNGKWWRPGSLELPENGEIAVCPMTTRDEIILKTPDALLNGQGIVNVIQSCCPSIKNAWDMPSIDIDTVLIALRIASFGNEMEFESQCPHCTEQNTHEVDLGARLAALTAPDYSESVTVKDLRIKLKPQNYFNVNRANQITFEEERLSQALNMPENSDPEAKAKMLTESMQRLVDLGIAAVANSTEYIEIGGDERVSDFDFINEFYQNVDRSVVAQIKDALESVANQSQLAPLQLQCNECSQPYSVELTFDYSSFFGKSS